MPRLTIRLDEDLLSRLTLFAHGRSNGHGPELSSIVREALETYLCARSRPTRQTPRTKGEKRRVAT
jgi:hypothetical protein